ncbi:hypothetical protein [Sphingomonas prati]|uniref:Bifunctional DNA-binding transcriptional regulator/antitoxin component of YhaV-PrlF toxin-antitoxin module n=1 Tax=Sphingomonas prati TaxID=1843237 RepID=A0A7W9F1I6_9SPHN|nr:hypothetical protein [Sphingomonas prati]MBB5727804.1 bifunctional DNA-binding transcriptional regulator/antitoxin component of YhaV-PrlF toxin-antitoxin module [Sphingomonas prati]
MNMHVNVSDVVTVRMGDDGMIQLPAAVMRAVGIVPGRPVMLGRNDRGEVVIFPETPEERSTRRATVINDLSSKHSTGQTTEKYMDLIRWRDAPL